MSDEVVRALRDALGTAAEEERRPLALHLAGILAGTPDGAAEGFTLCRGVLEEDPLNVEALDVAARASHALGLTARGDRYEAALELVESSKREALAEVVPLRVVGAPRDVAEVERTKLGLANVAGMEKVKRRLHLSFLGPLRNPELRRLYGKSLRGGLLLWGPPGCGKTFLARAVAGELGASFLNVGLDDVLDMYVGQSERNLRELFAQARRSAPCVLFFDELDALGQKRSHQRGGSGRNLVAQLLTELDGIDGGNDGVFVLGATNHPWDVDTALRRPGRFDRTLLVLPPDPTARQAILLSQLKDRPVEGVDVGMLAFRTTGFSGADLVHLCESATEQALADSLETGTVRPIRSADFDTALEEVEASTEAWLQMARNYAEFGGNAGAYDELLAYLRGRERAR